MGRTAVSPRLPSLRNAAAEARRVFARFPLVLAAAVACAVLGSWLVAAPASKWLTPAFAATTLALPMFIAVALTVERAQVPRASFVLHGAVTAVLIAFAQAWPHWSEAVQLRRYAQLSLAAHLLVAFLPYLRRGEPHGFWQYNRVLFLRFLTAALFSGVLYLGLTIALMALDPLFKIKVAASVHLRLWIWISFVFNTWFFLGGLPRDLSELEQRRDYPALLKVFAQFILIPLVAVYLAILTTYLGRILITGQWPKGWIGWLVSCVAATGILSLLLVHPIREREENRWVSTYARWFYIALLPSIGMLLAAIWQRVAQYGITEDRYFLLVLALWLSAIAVTFIARRNADIRWIPMTLCALALATMFGPWSAYDVSLRSQLARVRRILSQHGMFENGVARPASGPVPFEARKDLGGVLTYLIGTHGTAAARRALGAASAPVDTSGVAERHGKDQRLAAAAMHALNVDYVSPWQGSSSYFTYNAERPPVDITDVEGARHHVHLVGQFPIRFTVEDRAWELRLSGKPQALQLTRAGEVALTLAADSLVDRARRSPGYPSGPPLRVTVENAMARTTLVIRSYHGRIESDQPTLDSFEGDLYIGPGGAR